MLTQGNLKQFEQLVSDVYNKHIIRQCAGNQSPKSGVEDARDFESRCPY